MSDDSVDPYSLEENYLRTDGKDSCHWCYLRPQEYVWGPYGTRVCGHCQQMAEEGRAHDIVEELAARMTVREGWRMLDPEEWRRHEHEKMARWLQVRTTCSPIPPSERRARRPSQTPDAEDATPDEPFDPDDI